MMLINPYRFAAGDPYFANVVLLLHGDGMDGSTTITDSSGNAFSVTAIGNAQIDTAQSVWGGASIVLDGSGDGLSIPYDTDFNFGTGNFTIEFWARWNSKANYQQIYAMGSGAGSLVISTGDSNGLFKVTVGGGVDTTESGAQPNTGQWYFYQFIRTSGVVKIYRDGVERASGTNSGSISQTATIYLGRNAGGGSVFNGWVDDLRISNIARTPGIPTAAFPNA